MWECGLGCACEEAARLILGAENYNEFVMIEDAEKENFPETGTDFDAFSQRTVLYADLKAGDMPFAARLGEIEKKYGLGVTLSGETHVELFEGLEYLNGAHRALFSQACLVDLAPQGAPVDACERFFAYLVYRHASPAADAAEFALAVSFAAYLTRLFGALTKGGMPLAECARVISEELEYSEEHTTAILAALEKERTSG